VTVQVVVAPEFTLVGLQASAETRTGATRFKVVLWDAPFRVAVTVADWLALIVPTVALKVVKVALAGTVTDAGTVSRALLSESVMVAADAAAWFKLTAHIVDPPDATEPGLQLNDVKLSGTTVVIVPPVAVMGTALADWAAPKAFAMLTEVAVTLGEIVAVTTATSPFLMMLALSAPGSSPVNQQV
jgi:hypothetical protein